MGVVRDNWRISLLVVLVVLSAIALFVPGATVGAASAGNDDGESITNLQYGIQLDGGSRIRAPVLGITAKNVNLSVAYVNQTASDVDTTNRTGRYVQQAVADDLGLDLLDVAVRPESSTVEVFSPNVSQEQLATVLTARGFDVEADRDVSEGVTAATRSEMVRVIDKKLQISALVGADVRQAQTPGGRNFIVVEATGRDIDDLRSILDEQGIVRVYTFYSPENESNYTRKQVLDQDDFATIGHARERDGPGYGVGVTIKDAAGEDFAKEMREAGFTRERTCGYNAENPNESTGRCLLATLNGKVVFDGGVEKDLAESFRIGGGFTNDPTFQMTTTTREEARDLELSLKAGAPLPAPLDFEKAQTTSLQPALADRFKANSLITGLLAVLAVSFVVYLRYGDVRVAAPMVITATSEVLLLLGFMAAIQFPLDLSHIAGLIAVIGTGVDDLIIIADEILQQEGVATGRVFQNRFRKAFWVIGAAAATTIVAMAPLTVLSLGDLTGFAIVTIIGVLVGVLITRPAYGDILRHLVLSGEE